MPYHQLARRPIRFRFGRFLAPVTLSPTFHWFIRVLRPDGLFGPGWALGGLSVLSRCTQTYAQDGTGGAITLTSSDRYCLDGNRLRLTSGTYGQTNSTYQTEIANFSKITAGPTAAGNGPAYFTVRGKDGLIYEYGNAVGGTNTAQVFAVGTTTPYLWLLDKVSDRAGNNLTIQYQLANGSYVPSLIQYTQTPATGTAYHNRVSFTYTARPPGQPLNKYLAGGSVQQNLVMSTITASSDNVPGSIGTMLAVRVMIFQYTNGAATGKSRLASVQEASPDYGFPATSISYQDGAAGIATPTTAAVPSGATRVNSADFDGDGRADLIYAIVTGSTDHWYVRFATGSGYGPATDTGAITATSDPVLLDDFIGEGRVGVLAPASSPTAGTWTLYRWNASSGAFTATSLSPLTLDSNRIVSTDGSQYASADINGDGLPDLVWLANDGFVHARMNQAHGGVAQFGGDGNTGANFSFGDTTKLLGNNATNGSPVKHMDFDGDGRQDLLLEVINRHPANRTAYELVGRGSTIVFGNSSGQFSSTDVWPVNWNDDACTDLATINTNAQVYISGCNGALPINLALGTTAPLDGLAADWDGDGRTDLLVNVSGTWQVYVSQGTAASPIASTGISVGTGTWLTLDQNGDGLNDLAFASAGTGAITFGVHNGVGVRPDLATSFTDGFGTNWSPNYVSIARDATYVKYTDGSYPDVDWQGATHVVTSLTASDGAGGTYSQSYRYYGAHINLQGRGFDGFYARQMADNRTGTVLDTQYFARSFPYQGMLIERDRSQPSPSFVIVSQTLYTITATTLDSTVNNQRYFPYTQISSEYDHEVGGAEDGSLIKQIVTNYTFDSYGNPTIVTTSTTDKDATSPWIGQTWTTRVSNIITNDTTNWCLGHSTQTTVQNTLPDSTSVTRTTSATVDYVNCRESVVTDEPLIPSLKVTRNFSYDPTACGNVSQIAISGSGPDGSTLPARNTFLQYGSMCELPETVTNASGESTLLTYNYAFGLRATIKDPNNLQTTFTYDQFGRLQKATRPDGTYTTYTIAACDGSNSYCGVADLRSRTTRVDASSTGVGIHSAYLYSDGFGRLRYDEEQNLAGGVDYHVNHYDPVGRVDLKYLPFSTSYQDYHQYTYDLAGRVLFDKLYRQGSGFDRQVQYTYAGVQVATTDPNLNVTTRYLNVLGQVGKVMDPAPGGATQFAYEPFGQLVKVTDNPLNVSTWSYDKRGHLTSTSDPDRGAWTYESDSLGELLHIRDANTAAPAWTQQLSYDFLGRLIYRADGAAISRWVWGSSLGSYDRLKCINGFSDTSCTSTPTGYREVYGYDSLGRLSSTTYTADTTYTISYAYHSTTGLLDNLTYPMTLGPAPLRVQYAYTNGILSKVSDYNTPGTVYWQLNAQDAWDQPTNEQLQNGVHVLSSTDDLTGHLNSRSSGTNSGVYTNQQNVSYVWNANETLQDRIDANQGNLDEHFSYDGLNRVTGSTLAGSPNLTVGLDAIGNITTMSGVGSYDYITQQGACNYTGLTAQPHAVRKAGTYVYCYDKNGNVLSGRGATYSWTPYNLPASITNGSQSSSFFYTPDRRFWKQTAQYSGGPETTIYIGGLLEKVSGTTTTDYVHRIRAGSALVLVIRSTGTNSQTYYVTQDQLGSSTAITNGSGALALNESCCLRVAARQQLERNPKQR